MDFGVHRTKAALVAAGLAALAFASPAAASSPRVLTNPVTPFSCRASVWPENPSARQLACWR